MDPDPGFVTWDLIICREWKIMDEKLEKIVNKAIDAIAKEMSVKFNRQKVFSEVEICMDEALEFGIPSPSNLKQTIQHYINKFKVE